MAHDATKILLGATKSNIKDVDSMPGSIEAGLAVFQKSDGSGGAVKTDGVLIGISLGNDLSLANSDYMSVCRRGLKVPLQITAALAPTFGTQVSISDTTGKAAESGAGATAVNATYASGVMKGIKLDGTEVDVVLIDYAGGL